MKTKSNTKGVTVQVKYSKNGVSTFHEKMFHCQHYEKLPDWTKLLNELSRDRAEVVEGKDGNS